MKIIVGLGNPGFSYRRTRHNLGFMVVRALAERHHMRLRRGKFRSNCAKGDIEGERVALMQPLTFMNDSGMAVAGLAREEECIPEDILIKVDRMSMATSLEVRVPFLDHHLVEFAARIPGKFKVRGLTRKYILKKAMRGIVPPPVLKKKKEGFSIPLKNWLRKELRPLLLDTLSNEKLSREGFFNPVYVDRIVKEHLDGIQNHSHLLWALVIFELWLERHFRRSE